MALRVAAGSASSWTEADPVAEALPQFRSTPGEILAREDPFPAVVVDRRWNLLQANKGAVAMVEFLVGPLAPGSAVNLADALVGPDILRPHLTNWPEIVWYFVRSVEVDAGIDGTAETRALHERLLGYP